MAKIITAHSVTTTRTTRHTLSCGTVVTRTETSVERDRANVEQVALIWHLSYLRFAAQNSLMILALTAIVLCGLFAFQYFEGQNGRITGQVCKVWPGEKDVRCVASSDVTKGGALKNGAPPLYTNFSN